MRLYLAGAGTYYKYLDGLENLAILTSYYYRKIDRKLVTWCLEKGISMFLDSGAFSAMNKKETIDIGQYTDYCDFEGNKFEVIASLDVIGDWKLSTENHEVMKGAGINSIATFHLDSPFDNLKYLIETNNYIALGVKGQQGRKKKMHAWLDECFKVRDQIKPNCKIHGFGLTTPSVMGQYPFHSIDGSTWVTAAGRYGRIMILDGNSFKWLAISKQKQLVKYWDIIEDEFEGAWSLTEGRLPNYEKVAVRYNAKNLIELARRLS